MKRTDLPPPMPGRKFDNGDQTLMAHGGALTVPPPAPPGLGPDAPSDRVFQGPPALPSEPDLPDLPEDLPDGPEPEETRAAGTGEKMMSAVSDEELAHVPPPNLRKVLERRMPAPRGQRPTLMPSGFDMPPKLPGAPRAADPGLVRPVKPSHDSSKPDVGQPRESSDVIAMFPADGPQPQPMQPRAPDRPPPAAPAAQPGRLIRRGPPSHGGAAHAPSPAPAWRQPAPSSQPGQPHYPSQPSVAPPAQPVPPAAPPFLPLPLDRAYALVAEHRARLALLDLWARGLEIGAGLLGTVSLAVLIASLVSILVGNGMAVVVSATAIVAACAGLALTAVMVALATALRHVAHIGAQVAALLDALGGR